MSRKMYERTNQSTLANVDRSEVFAQGSFKDVYKGVYQQGPRTGQPCVVKFLRSGPSYVHEAFDHDLAIVDKAQELIDRFNIAGIINKPIYLNRPEVWEMLDDGQTNLVEPLIPNFQKFNSNSGWTTDDSELWSDVMQALSHFSYHSTGGAYVLCDLQGGFFRKGLVLTDPVVLSRSHKFGPTDLGPDGIQTFFAEHECNAFCGNHWTRPRSRQPRVPVRAGTSMMGRDGCMIVPTRNSRPPMTFDNADYYDERDEDDYEDDDDEEDMYDDDSDDYY